MITLQINGKSVELDRATSLLAYLERLGVNPRAVAIEYNGTVIERAGYEGVTLEEGDTVEIVRMVGGGRTAGKLPEYDHRIAIHDEDRIRYVRSNPKLFSI